jgi:hypothetical protein
MQISGIIVYAFLIAASGWEVLLFVAGICLLGALWYYRGISDPGSFSAAIYPLFQRIARSGMKGSEDAETDLPAVIEHAIFIDLEKDTVLNEAIKQASHAIRERLGGERKKIEDFLTREVRHWMHEVKFNISVAPVLLEGIGPPEMVIVRGNININDETTNGLIIILDDKDSPARLERLTAQLEKIIKKEKFPGAWENSASAKDIKEALI